MGAVADLLHALWVLATTASFSILIMEGMARRSPFYVALFVVLGCIGWGLHCEETGICSPLSTSMHARLQVADLGLSYFLLGVMILVVLEIRMEVTGRLAVAALAIAVTARDAFDLKFNVAACLLLCGLLLAIDARVHARRFPPAFWRRFALIAAMAAGGALLFKLVKTLWAAHGLWHLYYVSSCYLLLLAERTKKNVMARQRRAPQSAIAVSAVAHGVAGTTPMKRKSGSGDVTEADERPDGGLSSVV